MRHLGLYRRSGVVLGLAVLLLLLFRAEAQTLTYEDVLQSAIDQSYDLKIAKVDIGISKADVLAARSAYYPVIRGRINIERLKSLQDTQTPVTTIGDMVLPAGTRFQNSMSLSMTHTVTDFGVRRRKLDMAKKDVLAKATVYDQALRDLKLKVIEAYAKALVSYKSLQASEVLLSVSKDVYTMKKRLYQAGTAPKVDVAEEAIQLAQAFDDNEVYKQQLAQNLEDLSLYTQTSYDVQDIELADFKEEEPGAAVAFQATATPEAKMFEIQIDQKQKEIEMLQRQYLPSVALYSYYNVYGFDPDSLSSSIKGLAQRSVNLGLMVNMPIFDGFKNMAAIQKAKLEKEKLALRRDDKLADLKHQAGIYKTQVDTYTVQLKTKATILRKTDAKVDMLQRLSEQQVIEQTQAAKERIQRIQSQLQVEKSIIQAIVALKKLKIMSSAT